MIGDGDPRERMRLDEEKLETLRRWGEGLQAAHGDELSAAGRAILLLIDEVERLHIDLWHSRSDFAAPPGAPGDETSPEPLSETLRARLRRRFHGREPAFPDGSPHPVEHRNQVGEP